MYKRGREDDHGLFNKERVVGATEGKGFFPEFGR